MSSYLYDKVIEKKPDETVSILKSVETKKATVWPWQNSFDAKSTHKKIFF